MNKAALFGTSVIILGLVIFGAYGIYRSEPIQRDQAPELTFEVDTPTGAYEVEWPLDGNHVAWVADTGWTSESTIAFIAGGVELMHCTYYDPTHDTNEPSDENCTIAFERTDGTRTTTFRGDQLDMICRLTETAYQMAEKHDPDRAPTIQPTINDACFICGRRDVEVRTYVGLEHLGPICHECVPPIRIKDAQAE